MNIYELILDDENNGVYAISLVDNPAIQSDWVAFKGEEKVNFATVSEDKRLIIGAALIPNLPIFRRDEEKGEYYVYMSKDTIRKTGEKFLTDAINNNATVMHEEEVSGVVTVESWFKEGDHDKSMNFGLDLPDGTWVVVQRVNNEVIWQEYVKTGKLKGFSIEGFYSLRAPQDKGDLIDELEKILKKQP
jgi:hypothetical protein